MEPSSTSVCCWTGEVKVFLLDPNAVVPKRYDGIGYDLSTIEGKTILAGERETFRTGIAIGICIDGCYGRIAPRSGLALKYGIDVLAGVIDASYRGEIVIILANHGKDPVTFSPGDRIAQLIFEQAYTPELRQVCTLEELGDSDRGDAGFGSSGV